MFMNKLDLFISRQVPVLLVNTRLILFLIGISIMEKSKIDRLFLMGPIKLRWLSDVYKASPTGSALAVALLIVIKSDLESSLSNLTVSSALYNEFGMERGSFQRGLAALKKAGLVSYTPISGQSHKISITSTFRHVSPQRRS